MEKGEGEGGEEKIEGRDRRDDSLCNVCSFSRFSLPKRKTKRGFQERRRGTVAGRLAITRVVKRISSNFHAITSSTTYRKKKRREGERLLVAADPLSAADALRRDSIMGKEKKQGKRRSK